MSLMDAPTYDPSRDIRNRSLLIAGGVLVLLLFVVGLAGFATGHGWLFTDLPAEHRVNQFFNALEAKDYGKAYDIYNNGKPNQFGYSLARFTDDWTVHSDVKGPLQSHHVDKSRTDGTGILGTEIIVGVTVNGSQRLFINYVRSDGTLSCCSVTHEFTY